MENNENIQTLNWCAAAIKSHYCRPFPKLFFVLPKKSYKRNASKGLQPFANPLSALQSP